MSGLASAGMDGSQAHELMVTVKEFIAMIQTTATDLKANLGKYLGLVGLDDIHITKNGAAIAVLTAPKPKNNWVDDLTGVIPDTNIDAKQTKAERLTQKYESLD